jgi:hypothetical protein
MYFAITGLLFDQDETTTRIYYCESVREAVANFETDMRMESGLEPGEFGEEYAEVTIVSMLKSSSAIEEVEVA